MILKNIMNCIRSYNTIYTYKRNIYLQFPNQSKLVKYTINNITNSDEILNNCLESLGYLEITENTKKIIQEHIEKNKFNSEEEKILDILKLIVSTPDFQYC